MIEKPNLTIETWRDWADRLYPFDPKWEQYLLTRTERPRPGSDDQLRDLCGLRDRTTAALMAELWFRGNERVDDTEREQRADRDRARDKERKRLIHIAKLALDGKLGETRDDRDAAQATAQTYLGNMPPEQCDYDTLRDWEKMHQHAKAIAEGRNPTRPTLSRDRKREAQRKRELDDIDGAIDAQPAGKPQRHEQGSLYG
jgi:hypothetical protein